MVFNFKFFLYLNILLNSVQNVRKPKWPLYPELVGKQIITPPPARFHSLHMVCGNYSCMYKNMNILLLRDLCMLNQHSLED